MTDLTLESLTQALENLVQKQEALLSIKPTWMMMSPSMYRTLMWRSPIQKRKGIRGRKKALYSRSKPALWSYLK